MGQADHSLVLAVDGGGTRCRVAAWYSGTVTAVEVGPANASSDFNGAVEAVVHGLAALAAQLDCPADRLFEMPAFVGMAGVTGSAISARLSEALPLRQARIADDRPAAARGALGQGDGVIAHCGTGSFFAARIGGAARFSGGWGPVLGDEASAQWVGRAVLRLTLEGVDGRGPAAPICAALLDEFGDAAGIVEFAGTARPEDFGTLAPRVTAEADKGDPVARAILQEGAAQIDRALRALGWVPGLALCLTGGIGPHYAGFLPADLRRAVVAPQGTPLDGAIALARAFAEERADARG